MKAKLFLGHNVKCRYLGTAETNNNAYLIHLILGVLISSMLLLTTVTVLQKQNVYALSLQERYHSGLEHTFLWIVDALDAHSVQNFMVESGWIKFNALKIVPLTSYQTAIEICQSMGTT
jgi:hypothetical protein